MHGYCSILLYHLSCFNYLFILAALGLCCCVGFSPVAMSGGYSLVVVHWFLIAVASLVAEKPGVHGLYPR